MSPSPHPFGKKRIAFWDKPLRRSELLTLALPGILAVAGPLAYGYSLQQFGALYGPVAAQTWSRPWFQLAAAALVIFLGLILYRLLRSRQGLTIYDQGIVIRRSPLPMRALRWSELAGIAFSQTEPRFLWLTLKTRSQAVLVPNVGRPFRFHSTAPGLPILVDHLKAAFYPHLAPCLEEAFRSQQWVYFGPVAIHATGLRFKKVETAWETVERVSVQAGRLVVELRQPPHPRRRTKVLAAPVAHIPNLELLLDLMAKQTSA